MKTKVQDTIFHQTPYAAPHGKAVETTTNPT